MNGHVARDRPLIALLVSKRKPGEQESVAWSVLVEHLSSTAPNVQARLKMFAAGFVAKGSDAAQAKARALALLDGAARLQGSVLAFNDTFFVTAMLVLGAIPLIFVLGEPATTKVESAAH
jgi:DHA2 family multidrug resistance protein